MRKTVIKMLDKKGYWMYAVEKIKLESKIKAK